MNRIDMLRQIRRSLCSIALISGWACSGTDAIVPPTGESGAPKAASRRPYAAIKTQPAGKRVLSAQPELTGEVAYDPDHMAIVGPLVSGRIATVMVTTGTPVKKRQVLAELESPEAGQAMAQYITATARSRAAEAQLVREQDLSKQHISSARNREVAEAQAAEAHAAAKAAQQMLQALGIDAELARQGNSGRVSLRSPIDGIVVKRSIALGQAVERGTDAFVVANLSHLWVELEIFEKDLERVQIGQSVELRTDSLPGRVLPAKVAFIEPFVNANTRTANVRLMFINEENLLRPGQFVTAHMGAQMGPQRQVLAVPRSALETLDGRDVVFVPDHDTFIAKPVSVGSRDERFAEILAGLQEGEAVVVEGAFLLKANTLLR